MKILLFHINQIFLVSECIFNFVFINLRVLYELITEKKIKPPSQNNYYQYFNENSKIKNADL